MLVGVMIFLVAFGFIRVLCCKNAELSFSPFFNKRRKKKNYITILSFYVAEYNRAKLERLA